MSKKSNNKNNNDKKNNKNINKSNNNKNPKKNNENVDKNNNDKPPKKKNIVLIIIGKNKDSEKDKKEETTLNTNDKENIIDEDKEEDDDEDYIDKGDDEDYIDEDDDEDYIDEGDDEDYIDECDDEDEDEEFIDECDDEDEEFIDEDEEFINKDEEFIDDDEEYEDFFITNKNTTDDKEDNGKSDKKRKLDEDIQKEQDQLDRFFNIIIGGSSQTLNPLMNEPLKNKRSNPKKKKKKENFYDYFKESKELLPIDKDIETLDDLIDLGKSYNSDDENRYVINMKALNKCVPALEELNNFIGMKNIKQMIIDLIFFRLQNFEDTINNEMWHLVIQGSPGCGKTEISKVIGKLYYGLGIVENDIFTQVKRSELIGKYLGHTAVQTQEIFDKAEGGVLFIDEAYSLGNPEGRDNFSKECIDTINQNLTEKKNTVVIIAGYKDQLNESFFSYNPGLSRRFKMRMNIDSYDHHDLRKIYIKKLKENKWYILNDDEENEIPIDFFEKNRDIFKFNGGDMENLWSLTKIVHARRIFGKSNDLLKKITKTDIEKALKMYQENEEVKSRDTDKDLKKYIHNTMYC